MIITIGGIKGGSGKTTVAIRVVSDVIRHLGLVVVCGANDSLRLIPKRAHAPMVWQRE